MFDVRRLRHIAYAGASIGVLFHVVSAAFFSGSDLRFGLLLVFGSSLPYVACALIARLSPHPLQGLVPLVPAWALDGLAFYSVYVERPISSTASLALFWAPVWNLIVVVPVGAFIAWLVLKVRGERQAL